MKETIPLSVIIPTLKERKNLENLLKALSYQTCRPSQIIVSDAGSRDGTVEVARNYGCQVIEGGLPARGRNNGAAAARESNLLFLDADTLPNNTSFLESLYYEATGKKYDAATCDNVPILDKVEKKRKPLYRAIYTILNYLQREQQDNSPIAVGTCIFSTKNAFYQVGGFNEKRKFGEDTEYVSKVHKKGLKFGIFKKPKILVSVRRFEEEGMLKLVGKAIIYSSANKLRRFKLLDDILSIVLKEKYEFGKHGS